MSELLPNHHAIRPFDESLDWLLRVLGKGSEMDPCGECPKGTCDECEWCQWFSQPGLASPTPATPEVE